MRPTVAELEFQLKTVTDQKTRIDLLNKLARQISLEDLERSKQLAEQAYELAASGEYESEPYLLGQAASLSLLASCNNSIGKIDISLSQSFRVLEILADLPNDQVEVISIKIDTLGDISWANRSFGNFGAAAEYAMQALKLTQMLDDRLLEIRILNILSVIYGEAKDLKSALEMGLKVLEYSREMNSVNGESLALNNLALTYLDLGEGEKALETALAALRVAHQNEIIDLEISILGTVGEIYAANGDLVNAEEYLTRNLDLARKQDNDPDQIQCLANLGKIYQRQKKHQAAFQAFQEALSISQAINNPLEESKCHKFLSEIHAESGEFEKALQHFKQFHEIQENIFNEKSAKRLAGLRVAHQVETAKRDAEIHYLKTIELKREIEERKSAQESLQKLASIDPLTEVLNRREFFIQGEREVERALQKKRPLTVILFDLDHFKQINDTHGHAIGDQFLIHTTKTLRESLRQGEIIGRYGGDEFVILLPGSNRLQGQQIAERLCERLASQPVTTEKGDLFVNISLGVAELSQAKDSTMQTLLAHADHALYKAKRAGRNQLAVYPA